MGMYCMWETITRNPIMGYMLTPVCMVSLARGIFATPSLVN